MLISLCLVGVIGAGATFAYLSNTTGTLTNTFTVGSVDGDLKEYTASDGEELLVSSIKIATDTEPFTIFDYENLISNQVITKAPFVTVSKDSVEADAFLRVEGLDALLGLKEGENQMFSISTSGTPGLSVAWTKIRDLTGTGNTATKMDGIYMYVGDALALATDGSLYTAETATTPLFTNIKYSSLIETQPEGVDSIILKACIVQHDLIDPADPYATAFVEFDK